MMAQLREYGHLLSRSDLEAIGNSDMMIG